MSTFDIRYENWWFLDKIFGKSGWKSSKWKNEKQKTSVFLGP